MPRQLRFFQHPDDKPAQHRPEYRIGILIEPFHRIRAHRHQRHPGHHAAKAHDVIRIAPLLDAPVQPRRRHGDEQRLDDIGQRRQRGQSERGKPFAACARLSKRMRERPPVITVPVFPVQIKIFLHIGPLQPCRMQAHEQLIVFAAADAARFTIAICQRMRAKHHRGVDIWRMRQEIPRARLLGHPHMPPCPILIHKPAAAACPGILRMSLQKVIQPLQTMRG